MYLPDSPSRKDMPASMSVVTQRPPTLSILVVSLSFQAEVTLFLEWLPVSDWKSSGPRAHLVPKMTLLQQASLALKLPVGLIGPLSDLAIPSSFLHWCYFPLTRIAHPTLTQGLLPGELELQSLCCLPWTHSSCPMMSICKSPRKGTTTTETAHLPPSASHPLPYLLPFPIPPFLSSYFLQKIFTRHSGPRYTMVKKSNNI